MVRNRYGFRVGSLNLLIDADTGSEVIRVQSLSSLPGSAPWLLGLINLRANLAPIFDLRQVLGLERKPETREAAESAYRSRARVLHPDTCGNHDAFAELSEAIQQARAELAG